MSQVNALCVITLTYLFKSVLFEYDSETQM